MSLKPTLIEAVPADTARVARAAFPKGNLYLAIRDISRNSFNQGWLQRHNGDTPFVEISPL